MISRPEGARPAERATADEIVVAGETLLADCDGALYWPREGVLAVADLHLEKGSSFARRGVLLPPYDTAATLGRLSLVMTRYAPRVMIALGDSFHDDDGAGRIAVADRAALAALQRGRDWIWIAGNHDRRAADGVGGGYAGAIAIGGLMFRHEPTGAEGEIAGHLHPVARVGRLGHTVSRRCFAADRTAWSCRPSAPLPAASTYATAPLRTFSGRWPSPRICWARDGSMLLPRRAACEISPA